MSSESDQDLRYSRGASESDRRERRRFRNERTDQTEDLRQRLSSNDRGGNYSDPLFLSNSDNPGSQLVSRLFDGTNYHSWTHKVRVALGSKKKLGFITGQCLKPDRSSADFERWERCDYMVMSWLTNSMIGEIADNFLHVSYAKEMWDELTERFAESNRPLIFQLQKELINITQENMTVASYYNKMKKVWDELQSIDPLPLCECGVLETCNCSLFKRLMDREASLRVMQFLMGLSDAFENLRSNMLSQEPLPNLNKAFHMALQVERQKGLTMPAVSSDALAINRQGGNYGSRTSGVRGNNSSGYDARDSKRSKLDRKCDFCQEQGHVRETCFKLVGYPEWWKGPRNHGATGNKVVANVQDMSSASHPLEDDEEKTRPDSNLVNAVVQEVMKAFHARMPMEDSSGSVQQLTTSFSGPFH